MLKLLFRRLFYGLVTILVVATVIFFATEILPGDVAAAILGQHATPEALKAIRDSLGLDRPIHIRYFEWLHNLAKGKFGESLATGRKITELIGERLGHTIRLGVITAIFAVPLWIFLGIFTAMFPGSIFDRTITIGALCVVSVPEFFIAAILVMIFAVSLRWLPAIAYVSMDQSFFQTLPALILPVLTLTFASTAHGTRMTRTVILNILSGTYIEMALLRGASRKRIIICHALPNVLSPLFNLIALNLAWLLSGVVIIETVFAYPGIGKLMVDAVSFRDIPLVQALGMIFCGTYVGFNLLADIFSIISNPRLRYPK